MRIQAIWSHTLHTKFTNLIKEFSSIDFIQKLTVELSDRLLTDDRPGVVALSFGDDAGVVVECKYGQSDRVQAPAKRHCG